MLFRIIGRKGHVGGCLELIVPFQLLTLGLQSILFILRSIEENRISSGEVKFLEIRRNVEKRRQFSGLNLTLRCESVGSKQD